jgi:tRNA A-37 threonylcarbamoyl transferase component Bud32
MILDTSDKVHQFLNDILADSSPGHRIDMHVSPCTNGYINYVWRVKFARSSSLPLSDPAPQSTPCRKHAAIHPRLYDCSSLIVKSAAAFAQSNPALLISPARLDFEVDAVQLIQDCLHQSQQSLGIQIAQLYYYDAQSKIVLMEDLGEDLVELTEWVHHFTRSPSLPCMELLATSGAQFGARIGQFLRVLHTTVKHAKPNEHANGFFKDTLYLFCRSWFHQAGYSTEEAGRLHERMMSAFHHLYGADCQEPCFIIGDLRDSALLLRRDSLEMLSFIDFEFSGLASRLIDVADVTVYLWTLSLSYQAHAAFYKAALESFYTSYFDTSTNWQATLTPERERLLSTHMATRLCIFTLISDVYCASDCLYREKFGNKPLAERMASQLCVCKTALVDQAASLVRGTCRLADLMPFLTQ